MRHIRVGLSLPVERGLDLWHKVKQWHGLPDKSGGPWVAQVAQRLHQRLQMDVQISRSLR